MIGSARLPEWTYDPALRFTVQSYRLAGSTLATVVDPGQRPASRAGVGLEWFGRREYVDGDPQSIVDWRTLSRFSDREDPPMFVKTFDAELANLITIAVDCSGSMDLWPLEGKLSTALGTAALLAWSAANHGDPVEIVVVGGQEGLPISSTAVIRSLVDYEREMDALNDMKLAASGTAGWDLLVDPHEGLKGTRHTVVLVGDFFSEEEQIMQAIRDLRQHVRTLLAVRILCRSDHEPFRGRRDSELVDVEDPSLRRKAAAHQAAYTKRLQEHLNSVGDLLSDEGVRLAGIEAVPLRRDDRRVGPEHIPEGLIEARVLV